VFQLTVLTNQAAHAHTQIFHNQAQVVKNSLKVGLLLLHFVGLLFQLLNCLPAWANISFELLDLVIQDKFELLQLLRLLFQVVDALVFVVDGVVSFVEFVDLRFDLGFQFGVGLHEFGQLGLLVFDVARELLFLVLLGFEAALDVGEQGLAGHALVDDEDEFFLVAVFDDVDLGPGLVLDLLALFLVDAQHVLDLDAQGLALVVLLLLLQVVLDS